MQQIRKTTSAFTMIELLCVIIFIAILCVFGLSVLKGAFKFVLGAIVATIVVTVLWNLIKDKKQ